tara:strand:+ start:1971 stop:2840 length:870 start_codon:yes stop_codon:yes gene_type:complete
MAWKYRQEYHESGDALIPEDFLENQKEFVSEYNGYLDRDNFREQDFSNGVYNSPTAGGFSSLPLVEHNAFNAVFADVATTHNGNGYGKIMLLDLGGDMESIGWSTKGTGRPSAYSSFNTTPALNLNLTDDSLLIVEFSAHFEWMGLDLCNNLGTEKKVSTGSGEWEGIYEPSWSDKSGGEAHLWDVYVPDDGIADDNIGPRRMFACIKFRVLCNGDVVCESGWFANHVRRNSVYLVGAIPVLAGETDVQVQYKMAYVDNRVPGEDIEKTGVQQPCTMFERELIVHQRKR